MASKWLDALSFSAAPLISHVLPALSYQLMQLVGDKVRLWEPPRATCTIKHQCEGTSTYASSALFTKMEDWQSMFLSPAQPVALPLNLKSSFNLFIPLAFIVLTFVAFSILHEFNWCCALLF